MNCCLHLFCRSIMKYPSFIAWKTKKRNHFMSWMPLQTSTFWLKIILFAVNIIVITMLLLMLSDALLWATWHEMKMIKSAFYSSICTNTTGLAVLYIELLYASFAWYTIRVLLLHHIKCTTKNKYPIYYLDSIIDIGKHQLNHIWW